MASIAQKKRNKRKLRETLTGLPDMSARGDRKARGRKRMEEADPRRQNLSNRARAAGKNPNNKQDRESMAGQEFETQAGFAILAVVSNRDLARKAIDAYVSLESSRNHYLRRDLGISPHAKCSKHEMMPEAFETMPGDNADLRSDDEKDAAAKAAWGAWNYRLSQLDPLNRSAIELALSGRALMKQGKPTSLGRSLAVAALSLVEVVEEIT